MGAHDQILFRMNMMVSVTVLLSVFFLGVAMDIAPNSIWWIVLEAIFALVFVSECVVKCWIKGTGEYFCGRERIGHLVDMTLTIVAVVDVTFSVVMFVQEKSGSMKAARIIFVLRCVR